MIFACCASLASRKRTHPRPRAASRPRLSRDRETVARLSGASFFYVRQATDFARLCAWRRDICSHVNVRFSLIGLQQRGTTIACTQ